MLHVHHEIPISKGGSHEDSNLITLCSYCHDGKHPIKGYLRKAIKKQQTIKMSYTNKNGFTTSRELDPYEMDFYDEINMELLIGYDHSKEELRYFRPKRINYVEIMDNNFASSPGFNANRFLYQNFQYSDKSSPPITNWDDKPDLPSYKKENTYNKSVVNRIRFFLLVQALIFLSFGLFILVNISSLACLVWFLFGLFVSAMTLLWRKSKVDRLRKRGK